VDILETKWRMLLRNMALRTQVRFRGVEYAVFVTGESRFCDVGGFGGGCQYIGNEMAHIIMEYGFANASSFPGC